uniref:Chloride channel protein n=1 Tax=Steinernema glaseri TaxID=37863 RepID=A0A1I8A1N7_9BILA
MKTILRGVILKEYLTFRTLVSKMIGLTLSLGSGLPIGKEGPFVHVASVVANLLSSLVHNAHGVYSNESRSTEMLAAGCAVGVACTFSAPVGGVLFSIEVTSVYFAVRNYWRGFFAAACSATLFRLLKVWLNETEVCGLAGAVFVLLHRSMVTFLRRNGCAKRIFQKYWIIYPVLVSFLVATLTYPQGFGKFLAGDRKFSQTLKDFFSNCTWLTAGKNGTNACPEEFVETWQGYLEFDNSIFIVLACFQVTFFFLAALSSTLPIPAGIFMPVFVIGAAFGRMIGELMVLWFPEGIRGPEDLQIFPGVYAVVGAAAFCGAVTHTVSVAVIVFELTGQLLYILPVMIAVLIANAICSYLQPSIYDSIIKIKHLPFLPHIPHTSSIFHGICVRQIMVSKVKYLSRQSTYAEVKELITTMPRVKAFPVVEDTQSMILLGSVSRTSLADANR